MLDEENEFDLEEEEREYLKYAEKTPMCGKE